MSKASALPGQMSGSYNEFAQRWGNTGFTEYVTLWEKQANQVLPEASESIQQQAESAFLQIAQLEAEFWQMAFNAGTVVPNNGTHSPVFNDP
ncbi:MAG: hypothetical protein RID09_21865 [Coleofasciculus sp. G1-WW12-02]|uniref:hypothetical protein n=1 Tax=Coleofasciculus sp. G1-WW12-02 TaxID=3068483 RepID=UPI0032FA26DD